jgi:hypothetical protein
MGIDWNKIYILFRNHICDIGMFLLYNNFYKVFFSTRNPRWLTNCFNKELCEKGKNTIVSERRV